MIEVSVIIPCFNVAECCGDCLESCAAVSDGRVEFIFVDDASTDATAEIIEASLPRIQNGTLLRSGVNRGLHASRALGFAAAKGKLVAFLDGDDWFDPRMYTCMALELAEHDADLVICGSLEACSPQDVRHPKVSLTSAILSGKEAVDAYSRGKLGSGVIWNRIFRRSLVEKAMEEPFDRFMDSNIDYLINFGATAAAGRVRTLRESLHYYRIRPESMSRKAKSAENYAVVLRTYAECHRFYAELPEAFHEHIDVLYRRMLAGRGFRVQDAAELQPWAPELAEAVRLLGNARPQAVYEWMNSGIHGRKTHPRPIREVMRELHRTVWAKFHA